MEGNRGEEVSILQEIKENQPPVNETSGKEFDLEPQHDLTSKEEEVLHEMGIDLTPQEKLVAVVAHNANSPVLIEKAHEHGANEIEIDIRFSRENRFWQGHRLHARHSQLPMPFRDYPDPRELVNMIDPEKRVVLDIKILPNHPFAGRSTRTMIKQLGPLLEELEAQGRSNTTLTGGNEEMFSYFAERYPHIDLRWTVWSERGFKRLLNKYDDKVKAVSVWARVLKKMGMQAFEGKDVYVFGADEEDHDLFKKMGVSGIGTDSYKEKRNRE